MSISQSKLKREHLEDLLAFEAEYPPAFRLGRSVLKKKLSDLDESECSLSWVLHDEALCVAYILVYPQYSRLERRQKERVIYVDDVFVQKGYEACLFRLIKLFTGEARTLGLRDWPIEGVCRVSAYRNFANHDPLLQRLGWQLSQKSEYWDNMVNEEMCWLRWEPLYQSAASISTRDQVSVSGEASKAATEAQKVVTLEDSERYAYVPLLVDRVEEEPDEFEALTEIMIGKGEDDLVEIIPEPPVNKKELLDVFGILEFFGSRHRPRRERILRRRT